MIREAIRTAVLPAKSGGECITEARLGSRRARIGRRLVGRLGRAVGEGPTGLKPR